MNTLSGTVPYSFDLKFEILYEQEKNVMSTPIGIRLFYTLTNSACFYSSQPALIAKWHALLAKRLNQRGFHEMFKPIRKLGSGNFASVYEVERFTDKAKFAVKAFSKNNTFNAKNGKESLINELNVLRCVNQNNILKLEAVYESDNSIYVVMELLTGDQFFKKIQERKGHFTSLEIRRILYGLIQGLEHLHANRIIHRDLKPENIMLRSSTNLVPVIVDFGLATQCDINPYLFFRCGTPGYVAPEIVELKEHRHIEPQCDIFSVGVIFHILLTRRPLFEGSHYEEVYRRNREMAFNLDSETYSFIDQEAMHLLRQMLNKNWQDRISAS